MDNEVDKSGSENFKAVGNNNNEYVATSKDMDAVTAVCDDILDLLQSAAAKTTKVAAAPLSIHADRRAI